MTDTDADLFPELPGPMVPTGARILAEEAFAKVYNDPVTLAQCLEAALVAAAPGIRSAALTELAAELRADARNPDLRSIVRGLNHAIALAEQKASALCK